MPKYLVISLIPIHRFLARIKGFATWITSSLYGVPKTEAQLEAWFERAFNCEEGIAAATYGRDVFGNMAPRGDGEPIYHYQTYAMFCRDEPGAEARLCDAIYRDFLNFAHRGITLVWRRMPRVEHEVVSEFGPCLCHKEDVQDGFFKLPKDAAFNSLMDTWHSWKVDTPLCRIRMRLNLEMVPPELLKSPTSFTIDGYPTPHLV